jgi:hypothetical protein
MFKDNRKKKKNRQKLSKDKIIEKDLQNLSNRATQLKGLKNQRKIRNQQAKKIKKKTHWRI